MHLYNTMLRATALAGVVAAAGCALVTGSKPKPAAQAILHDAQGTEVARATLKSISDDRVVLEVHTTAVAEGTHGIHIHAVGSCTAPAFTDAGGHFNPSEMKHGLENAAGPHNGDLPNIVVGANGRADYIAVTTRVMLEPGANNLFDADGSAIVIHATADDQKTDPSGNSGARIACGVIAPH